MNTSPKVALITGAAKRIGAQIAKELHQRDFNIVIHYRNSQQPADNLALQLNKIRPHSAICIQANLTAISEVQQLATQAEKVWGKIDALVNNASSFYPTPLENITEQNWDDLINSNLKGPFFLSQALAPSLKEQQGCIINIVDIYSERPLAEHSIYCIAKSGVAMMTKVLAKELAPKVRVNGISPGAILWPENNLSAQQQQTILEKVPLQRIGDASDIAQTVAFLIADAPYINGQIIAVDGGRNLHI